MIALWAGAALGLAGSLHCAAMCGPFVAIAAPRGWRMAVHHLSRIGTYVLLGIIAGLAGHRVVAAGFGWWLSLVVAVALLVQAFARWTGGSQFGTINIAGRSVVRGVTAIRIRMARHPLASSAAVGALNGLLPCGLVYAALLASLGSGGPREGALLMGAFGAGTTPLLAIAAVSLQTALPRTPALRKLAPLALLLVAILIAARGLTGPPLHHH